MRSVRLIVGLLLVFVPIPVQAADSDKFTVMTRNVYLGADVTPAMELLPNFSAAAEFLWTQMQQTDFHKRSVGIAREVKLINPDVIALQEATQWVCAGHVWSRKKVVYDFTQILLAALNQQGMTYKVATANGAVAANTGFSINPIPGVTIVSDSATFQPLFGTDTASCGFRIADVLLVKSEHDVIEVGNTEYKDSYTIIPTLMTVYRGYTWADIQIHGSTIRFVATHLESLFDANKVPVSKHQADQLVADAEEITMPLVVMGDLNSDPRDPRSTDSLNPGGQPEANSKCQVQTRFPTAASAIDTCNAYWTMISAGFMDSGPDATAAQNFTWGYNALLTGPDPRRSAGMTDRLDYVMTKNVAQPIANQIFGNQFPEGSGVWNCGNNPCAASDHAGVAATFPLPMSTQQDDAFKDHRPFPIGFWKLTGISISSLLVLRLRRRFLKKS